MRLEPHRLVFLDETGTTPKMTRLRGRCLKGQRLRSNVVRPLEDTNLHRRPALPRPHRAQLAPTLEKGDVVIMDNLSAHKSPAAEKAIRAKGAWLLFLSPYSPDLNPIEMAFAKLKAHLRARAVRTIDASGRQSAKSPTCSSQTLLSYPRSYRFV